MQVHTHTHTHTRREWTSLHWPAEHIIEREKELKGKRWQNRGVRGNEMDRHTVFTSRFFSKSCGLPSEAQGGFLMKAQEGAAAGGMYLSREDKTPRAGLASSLPLSLSSSPNAPFIPPPTPHLPHRE